MNVDPVVGLASTLSVVVITFLTGFSAALLVVWAIKHYPRIQRSVLPFFDELTAAASVVGKELLRHPASRPLSGPRALRQGLVFVALALVTGATIHGVLVLIGSLATPAG